MIKTLDNGSACCRVGEKEYLSTDTEIEIEVKGSGNLDTL